jgi:transglutaminase-like putative cysteine protease
LNRGFVLAIAIACLGASCAAPRDRRTFEVQHAVEIDVPQDASTVRLWLALPQQTRRQRGSSVVVDTALPSHRVRDSKQNEMLFFELLEPPPGPLRVRTSFELEREAFEEPLDPQRARPLSDVERLQLGEWLEPSPYLAIDERIERLARQLVEGEENPVLRARRLYDWVVANVDHEAKDPAGSTAAVADEGGFGRTNRSGSSTDLHALYTALARACGIPTRMVFGSLLKHELDGIQRDQGLHCWVEFFASGIGWIPLDVALADLYVGDFSIHTENASFVRLATPDGYRGPEPDKVEHYFGHLDTRRITWSVGRGLELQPPPAGGVIDALRGAYVEIDGVGRNEGDGWTRKLTYRERVVPE